MSWPPYYYNDSSFQASTEGMTFEADAQDGPGPEPSSPYSMHFPSTSSLMSTVQGTASSGTHPLGQARSYTANNFFYGSTPEGLDSQVPVTGSQATMDVEEQAQSNDGPPPVHPVHIVAWYLLCWNAVIVNGPRTFVPQTIYQPYSQGDRERYVALATLLPPIIFYAENSPEWGLPVRDLLARQGSRLRDGDDPAFTSAGPSVSIRVQWPGYAPCHKQIATRDYSTQRRPITKAKLAKLVAKCVNRFMRQMGQRPMHLDADRRWKVGNGPSQIKVDDIILVSLHHVSQGSWQPQLRLSRPVA